MFFFAGNVESCVINEIYMTIAMILYVIFNFEVNTHTYHHYDEYIIGFLILHYNII